MKTVGSYKNFKEIKIIAMTKILSTLTSKTVSIFLSKSLQHCLQVQIAFKLTFQAHYQEFSKVNA